MKTGIEFKVMDNLVIVTIHNEEDGQKLDYTFQLTDAVEFIGNILLEIASTRLTKH